MVGLLGKVADQLERWVRQFAWLNAAPQSEQKGKAKAAEPVSRIKAMKERGEKVRLPPNPAPHLTDWLFEIGPRMSGAMGDGPITWQEIEAWEGRMGIELDPWESRTLRRLSQAWGEQASASRKPTCPAPYSMALPEETRKKVDQQFKALVGAFGKQKVDSPKGVR